MTEHTESTNADLAASARAGAPEGTVATTDDQRSGRGRLNRAWSAPPRSGLVVSVLVRPDAVPTPRWPWLPLLAGVAVLETVLRATTVDAVLKWPNDVMVGDRKLAGILTERIETPDGAAAVIGIGLNVDLGDAELPTPHATALNREGAAGLDRSVLLRNLLRTFEPLYRGWLAASGDPAEGLHESYVRRCSTLDKQVRVQLPGGKHLAGTAVAVDAAGRLVVDSAGTRHALGAGDVVHLRPHS